MKRWKVAGAFLLPKGITLGSSNFPSTLKANFCRSSGSISTCQKARSISIDEKKIEPHSASTVSSILGNESQSFDVKSFTIVESMQKRYLIFPLGNIFFISNAGLHQELDESWITPCFSISLTCSLLASYRGYWILILFYRTVATRRHLMGHQVRSTQHLIIPSESIMIPIKQSP